MALNTGHGSKIFQDFPAVRFCSFRDGSGWNGRQEAIPGSQLWGRMKKKGSADKLGTYRLIDSQNMSEHVSIQIIISLTVKMQEHQWTQRNQTHVRSLNDFERIRLCLLRFASFKCFLSMASLASCGIVSSWAAGHFFFAVAMISWLSWHLRVSHTMITAARGARTSNPNGAATVLAPTSWTKISVAAARVSFLGREFSACFGEKVNRCWGFAEPRKAPLPSLAPSHSWFLPRTKSLQPQSRRSF